MAKEEQNLIINSQNRNIDKGVKKYAQVYGPSTSILRWGLWWINNRTIIKRLVYGLLIIFSVAVWSYTIYNFGFYLYKGIDEDEVLLNQLMSIGVNPQATARIKAQDLEIGSINIVRNPGGTSDFFATISNANSDWYAKFDYYFEVNSQPTETRSFFINPQETKYITEFLYPQASPANAKLIIKNLQWRRVDHHAISDINSYLQDHLNIEVENVDFQALTGVSDRRLVSFTANNNTPYNYWAVDFYLLIKSGSRVVAINKYQLNYFPSGQARDILFVWPNSASGGNIEILPSVDIFNNNNYFKFDLGPGQLK